MHADEVCVVYQTRLNLLKMVTLKATNNLGVDW
jgi:hypothetical protein